MKIYRMPRLLHECEILTLEPCGEKYAWFRPVRQIRTWPKCSQESSHLKIEERENDRLIMATPLWDELGKAVSGSHGKRFSYP